MPSAVRRSPSLSDRLEYAGMEDPMDVDGDVRLDLNRSPLDRYVYIKELGVGAYGKVHKVYDAAREREVAIKYVEYPVDIDDARRVLMEIRCLREIRHPNVLSLDALCGVFCHNGLLGLVMPLYDTTLGKVIRSKQGLNDLQREHIMGELLRALCHLHRAGIIHCDVKPDNILLNANCDTVLADFGLSRACIATDDKDTYVVTRWYRAPELLFDDTKYDATVDVWAAGCVLCEMMKGKPLFPGRNDGDQIDRIVKVLGDDSNLSRQIGYENFKMCCQFSPLRREEQMRATMPAANAKELSFLSLVLQPERSSSSALLQEWCNGAQEDNEAQSFEPICAGLTRVELLQALREQIDWNGSIATTI